MNASFHFLLRKSTIFFALSVGGEFMYELAANFFLICLTLILFFSFDVFCLQR